MARNVGDTLAAGAKLGRGDSLTSNNGAYTLTLQDDGNLVLVDGGTAVWATATNGQPVTRAELQTDGNFVLYTADKPVWHTDTQGKTDVKLVLQDDRNLVLYAKDGVAWASGTNVARPSAASIDGGAGAISTAPQAQAASAGIDGGAGAVSAVPPVQEEQPAAPADEPAAEPARTYTVVSGDTLWAIAERFYGDGSKYQQIADASGIANPDLIHPGQVLTIP